MTLRDRNRRPTMQPMLLSGVLPAVSEAMHLPEKVAELTLIRLWGQLAPPDCRPPKTQATRIRRTGPKKHLVVEASNAHVATQLHYLLEGLTERLNTYAPQTGLRLDGIVVQVAKSQYR